MKIILFLLVCAVSSKPLWSQVSSSCDSNFVREELNAELIEIGILSDERADISVIAAGNKIFFAGGYINSSLSKKVDIYDVVTDTWTTAELSAARYLITTVANDTKVFFAGGETGDGTTPVDNVDIYDLATNTWSSDHLSTAGHSIAATVVGNKVMFAGGDGGFTGPYRETRVDIFDQSLGTWTTTSLSGVKRGGHAAVTVGDKAYFAGGEGWTSNTAYSWFVTDKIDIYDNATDTWSTKTMYENKSSYAGLAVKEKIYWAGGHSGIRPNLYWSTLVEIYDTLTDTATTECLSRSTSSCFATRLGDQLLFLPDPYSSGTINLDLFAAANDSWYFMELPVNLAGIKIISANGKFYVVGWDRYENLNYTLYELQFSLPLSIPKTDQDKVSIYPNPATDYLNITATEAIRNVAIYDLSGRLVQVQKFSDNTNEQKMNLENLMSGIYFFKVMTEYEMESIKVIKN